MNDLWTEAKRVNADEGKLTLLSRALRRALSPVIGFEDANLVHYRLNRMAKYHAWSPPASTLSASSQVLTDEQYNYFFGFYDHSPFDEANRRVLVSRTTTSLEPLNSPKPLELCYYDLDAESVEPFGTTKAWNWQQGCRLQWHPTLPDTAIYNKHRGNEYLAVCQNVDTGEITNEFDRPLYEVGPDGIHALSLNFSRLERLHPDYGYVGHADSTEQEAAPSADGIHLVDLGTGTSELLVSYRTMMEIADAPPDAHHYAMNLMISPAGDGCSFLHRYHEDGERVTNLFHVRFDGKDPTILQRDGEASHPLWIDDDTLFSTVNYLSGIRNRTEYVVYQLNSEPEKRTLDIPLDVDLHPSLNPRHNDILVADTYPDKYGERTLYLIDMGVPEVIDLGAVYGPVRNGVKRDLHPRWDNEGNRVCVDLPVHGNRKALGLLDVSEWMSELTASRHSLS